jgi:serine/threonine-protein kinase RsbT
MKDGFSTARSLGLGLPGAKRLVSEFDIKSVVGEGTTVTIIKWKNG